MKKILYILFFVNSLLYSQWIWLNPTPQGNQLKQVIRLNNGNVISAGGCGTIILSTNNGLNWTVSHRVHDTASAITSLFRVNDNLIFAGSWESRILRSTDAGLSWQSISRVNPFPGLIRLFFVDANSGFALFGSAVYKTSNGGLNWFLSANTSLFAGDIFFADNNTGFVGGGAITDNSVLTWIMKSTNGGINWFNIQPPDIGPISRIQFINVNTGYFSGYSTIYKTTNSGLNWQSLNLPTISNRINDFHFFNENICYAGTDNSHFYKTTNGGVSWDTLLIPYYTFNAYYGITSMSFSDQQHGYALIHGHIIVRTDNGGLNWTRLTNSMNLYTPLKSIEFIDNNTALLGGWGTTNDFIIRKTTNGGINWNGIVPYDYQTSTGYIYDIDFPSSSTGYAVGGGSKGYVYKSTNAGNNWIKLDSMGTGSNFVVHFTSDNTGYVLGYSGEIFRTSNGGFNWSTFNSGVSFRLNSIYFINPNTGYTCGGDAVQKLLKTTDAGMTWNQIYSTTGSSFSNITFINSNTGFISAKGILKTTDGGNTWSQKISGQLPNFHRAVFPSNNIGFAYAAFGRLFKTTDSGESWGELGMPTDYHFGDMHFLDNNTGYLIGDQGMILKTTNGGGNYFIGINSNNNSLPVRHELYQNYPNPFNPLTKIRYDIANNTFVSIKIYDILGREVISLVNESKQQGSYEVSWNASSFPSGVYFYELQSGSFKERKKMVLIK